MAESWRGKEVYIAEDIGLDRDTPDRPEVIEQKTDYSNLGFVAINEEEIYKYLADNDKVTAIEASLEHNQDES
jgi:hypothetical protein